MTSSTEERKWIEDFELVDAQVKWSFSNFAGAADAFNAKGDHNFTVILDEAMAMKLREDGFNVKVYDGREEGDPPEYTLKIKIGMTHGDPPKMYLVRMHPDFPDDPTKAKRIRIENGRDLADIHRSTTERLDVVGTPYRWIKGNESGVAAYVKELYAVVKTSRVSSMYDEIPEV